MVEGRPKQGSIGEVDRLNGAGDREAAASIENKLGKTGGRGQTGREKQTLLVEMRTDDVGKLGVGQGIESETEKANIAVAGYVEVAIAGVGKVLGEMLEFPSSSDLAVG